MSKLRHYAFIASLRGIDGITGKSNLQKVITKFSTEEIKLIASWEETTRTVPITMYSDYSPSELSVYLGMETGFYCSLNPISTLFGSKDGRQALIAYYIFNGYSVDYPRPIFTDEQKHLCDFPEGAVVVNAGPGTGKTTIGVERAFRKSHEGVLIVSYSNEAAREIYKRFKKYPAHRGKVSFKDLHKQGSNELYPIVVTTLDSLAWKLSGKGSIGESESSHDTAVKDAISAISHGKVLPFKHIISDESQDIDDLRGQMVKLLYATGGFQSILILGDPRQRISEAGLWYSDMWVKSYYDCIIYKKCAPKPIKTFTPDYKVETNFNIGDFGSLMSVDDIKDDLKLTDIVTKSKDYERVEKRVDVVKIGLTYSHRFKSRQLLELHNTLSSKRLSLHVELRETQLLRDYGKFKCYNVGGGHDRGGMSEFASFIKTSYIDTKFCSPKDICVIVPSVSSDNATSKKSQMLCSVFADNGLNCYTRREGSFIPNAILVTTIQSVKGKEFAVVIIYCMSEFPKFHPHIPFEQADSLIYVASTRAKLETIFLCNGVFTPPRGINIDMLTPVGGASLSEGSQVTFEIRPRCYSVNEMVESRDWSKLIHSNDYSVEVESEYECPIIEDTDLENEGLMVEVHSFIFKTIITGSFPKCIIVYNLNKSFKVSGCNYSSFIRDGQVADGLWLNPDERYHHVVLRDGINELTSSDIELLLNLKDKALPTITWNEWIKITRVYIKMAKDYSLTMDKVSIPSGPTPYELFKTATDALIGAFGRCVSNVIVKFSWTIGYCDLVFRDVIIQINTRGSATPDDKQKAMVTASCYPKNNIPVMIYSLKTGKLEKLTSDQHILTWRYIVDVYGTIKNHVNIVTQRKNEALSKGRLIKDIPLNVYVADTEFEKAGIFDFAMVNLTDPFLSIVQPLRSYSNFAVSWIADHHIFWKPQDLSIMFRNSRNYKDLDGAFFNLGKLKESKVLYYKAKEDGVIPLMYSMQTEDMGRRICHMAQKKGSSSEGSLNVKLGEIYDLTVKPLEFQRHLHQHSALTDSLILYELIHLGIVEA
jgi:hypothetical protein